MARWLVISFACATAGLAGCESAATSAAATEDPSLIGAAGEGAIEPAPSRPLNPRARLFELARIEGYGDPRTGELWSRIMPAAPSVEGVAASAQALSGTQSGYCAVNVVSDQVAGSNPPGTFEYYTSDRDGTTTPSIPNDDSSFDVATCFGHLQTVQKTGAMGTTHMSLFDSLGVGCALQNVGNFTSNTYAHVYLDVDLFQGEEALQTPYGPPYTTGTVATPPGRNAPDQDLGLWDFGMLGPDDSTAMWIYFKNGASTKFTFTGSLLGEVVEDCGAGGMGNGVDEDCDGVADNGCAAFDYGDPCFFDDDCNNGTCIGETVTSAFGEAGGELANDIAGVCCSATFDCGGVLSDTMSPTLNTLTYSPTMIDTTSGSAMVMVSLGVTDDLSGVNYAGIRFRSPSNAQGRTCTAYSPSSTCNVSFPQYSEAGTWTVDYVYTWDMVGNYHYYYTAELQSRGLPTTLAVTSAQDTTPPALNTLTYSPTMIDTTSGSAMVMVSLGVTDDISGVNYAGIRFRSPSNAQGRTCTAYSPSSTCNVSFPQYSEAGTWTVDYVYTWDVVGNYHYYYTAELQGLGFTTTLQVTSVGDTMPPVLNTLSYNPTTIDTTSGSAMVMVSLGVTDDLSGVNYAGIRFKSPSNAQGRTCTAYSPSSTCNVSFPQYSEVGTWTVDYVYTWDMVGNYHYYYTNDLQGSFPIMLDVQ